MPTFFSPYLTKQVARNPPVSNPKPKLRHSTLLSFPLLKLPTSLLIVFMPFYSVKVAWEHDERAAWQRSKRLDATWRKKIELWRAGMSHRRAGGMWHACRRKEDSKLELAWRNDLEVFIDRAGLVSYCLYVPDVKIGCSSWRNKPWSILLDWRGAGTWTACR